MEAGTNIAPEGAVVTNNTGTVHAQRDAWIGNSFHADLQNFNLTANLADLPPDLLSRLIPHRGLVSGDTPEQRRSVALNILYYEGFNAKRDHLSRQVTSVESFTWIENTEWPEWLSRSDDKPCWISGLPGSGKSTLIKYLSENRRTRERLPSGGKKWYVVYFFFDYRGGSGLQNNIKGLIQLFLGQIVSQNPSVLDHMGYNLETLVSSSISTCTDVLCQVIAENSFNLCAFVDGLDEYQGDSWDIYSLVQNLRERAFVKFCFASRPDTALTSMLTKMSVLNIVVHHHNLSAIQACVDFKMEALQLKHYHLTECISSSLCNKLVDRAEGVILWASLVIDEIFKELLACSDPLSVDVDQILDSVPSGLDALYNRILAKISPQMSSGAALFLYLLQEYEASVTKSFRHTTEDYRLADELFHDCPLDVMLQAWSFVQHICRGSPIPLSEKTLDEQATTLRAFVGDLVDIYSTTEETEFSRPTDRPVRTRFTRLIHKSFSTAIAKNLWLENHLDPDIKLLFPNRSWRRLGLYMMKYVPQLSKRITNQFELYIHTSDQGLINFYDEYTQTSNKIFSGAIVNGRNLRPYQSLFVYCAKNFPHMHQKQSTTMSTADDSLCFPHDPKNSSMLHAVYCRMCYGAYWREMAPFRDRVLNLYGDGYLDLYCTLIHGDTVALIRGLNLYEENTRAPLISDLFDIIIFRSNNTELEAPRNYEASIASLVGAGAKLKPTHLCGMGWLFAPKISYEPTYGSYAAYKGEDLLSIHETACASRSAQPTVAHHWLHATGGYTANSRYLALLIISGIDVNQCFREEGGIFHAILKYATKQSKQSKRLKQPSPILHFSCKFLVAAEHFLPPVSETKAHLASSTARRLREESADSVTRAKQRKSKTLQFLRLAEEALHEAERMGKWGPKLDLFDLCYVVRDGTPLKGIDI